jgi:cytochrome c553
MWMQSLAGVVLAVVLGWVGCASPGAGDGSDPKDPADANTLARGAALYGELCAVCHGHQGQGASGPVLAGFSRGEAELTSIIDQRMPVGRPEQCRGACARDIAREYRSTISALFGWDDSRCPMPEFRFKPTTGMPKTVHLAGSMNGWPGTIAAGGWPLAFDSAAGAFRLRRALPVGSYQYKFVIDEKDWIPDPENPNRVPDGFGGQNSLISVSCKPMAPPSPTVDVAASLPPDARPDGFPFDDHTEARVVSPVHAEEYRRAAMTFATAVAADVAPLVPCDGSGGNRAACTEQFVRSFGLRAFRRPLLPSERTRYQALAASAARARASASSRAGAPGALRKTSIARSIHACARTGSSASISVPASTNAELPTST